MKPPTTISQNIKFGFIEYLQNLLKMNGDKDLQEKNCKWL